MTAATLLEQVRDDVWALTVPLPFGAQPASSFAYLLRDADGMLHVVDPGWHTDDNWAALQSAVTELGSAPSRVLSIVLTHLHGDHLGMAERLRSASGARVLMHRAEVDALAAQSSGTSTGDPRTAHADAARLDVWGVPREVRAELATVDPVPSRFRDVPLGGGGRHVEMLHEADEARGQCAQRIVPLSLVAVGGDGQVHRPDEHRAELLLEVSVEAEVEPQPAPDPHQSCSFVRHDAVPGVDALCDLVVQGARRIPSPL